MLTRLANVSVLVGDYDEAVRWYTEVLGLELRMDGSMGGDYRFITVGVRGQDDVSIVLHKGEAPAEGQRGLLFHTDDCRGDVERLRGAGVTVTLEPEDQPGASRPWCRTPSARPTCCSSPAGWPSSAARCGPSPGSRFSHRTRPRHGVARYPLG